MKHSVTLLGNFKFLLKLITPPNTVTQNMKGPSPMDHEGNNS